MKSSLSCYLLSFSFLVLNYNSYSQNAKIEIETINNDDNSVDLLYEKNLPGSYVIKLNFSNITNCYTYEYNTVVKNFSGKLLRLTPNDPKVGIGFSLNYIYSLGVPNPKIDPDFVYHLPFKKGKKIRVDLAQDITVKYFGKEKQSDWFSFVVNSENTDTICSIRKGIVIDIINDFDTSISDDLQYTNKRNSIVVEHPDGTFAEYTGFKRNEIFVNIGQQIYPQTELGTIDLLNNVYRFDFCIYYKSIVKRAVPTNSKNASTDTVYKFLSPYFWSEEGKVKINSSTSCIVDSNDELIISEFTKSEKKKFFNDKKSFINKK